MRHTGPMTIDLHDRKHERSWFVLTVVFFVLSGAWIALAVLSEELAVWQLVVAAFSTLNALLWWLYLRHERRKREAAAENAEPHPTV